jgi:hypothetical protein
MLQYLPWYENIFHLLKIPHESKFTPRVVRSLCPIEIEPTKDMVLSLQGKAGL